MAVERVKLAEMNPALYNPRKDLKPGDEAYQQLADSIDKFGLVELIVWNRRSGNIVGGHQRYKVLLARGEIETDAVVVDLDDEDEKTLNLALNNIHGKNDDKKLKALLEGLSADARRLTGVELDKYLEEARNLIDEKPQIAFTEELHEEHNYIVLYFTNDVDWLNAQTLFGLKSVKALDSRPGFEKIGIGRVLNGAEAINRMMKGG